MRSVGFIGIVARAASLCAALLVNANAGPGDWSGQGPFGGSIVTMLPDPLVPTRVYAATSNGFFRSDDAGTSWAVQETGLLIAHPVNGVFAVSPNLAGTVWMFDDAGRLYGSSDAGNNWIPTGYSAGVTPAPTLNTNSLAQGTGSTVWFAGNTAGLLKSTDNGATFAAAGNGFPSGVAVTLVATNPHNTDQVIASPASGCNVTTGACSIWISANGGGSWIEVANPDGVTSATQLARHIKQIAFGSGTAVYVLYGSSVISGKLMNSSDSGAHWTLHSSAFGFALAASPSDATTVWIDDTENTSISTNSGSSFTPLSHTGRTTNGVFVPSSTAIAISPDYATTHRMWLGTYYAGTFLSNDSGTTWTSSNDGMTASDIRTVVVHPADNTRIFAGYGDSIGDPSPAFYRSTSTGTWNASNSGLKAFQLRTILIDPTTAGTVGSTVLFGVGSGFDLPNGNFDALAISNSGIYKSGDGGLTWATLSGGIPTDPDSGGPYVGNLRTIIADPRSCDGRASTAAICATGPLKTLYATGGGLISGSSHSWRVLKSIDGGATWNSSETDLPADINGSLGAGSYDRVDGVTPIVMDPSDSSILYIGTFAVAVGPTSSGRPPVTPTVASGVYKSTDSGAHWTIASTGLPTYPSSSAVLDTLSLAIDPAHPGTLWVSTVDNALNPGAPGQIYKTTNGGANWNVSNAGVSGPDVRALLVDPSNPGTLYAASGGIGPANPGGVYKSTDGGVNWMSISVGLPAFSATALTLDPVDPTVLYAGTTGGVYSIVQLPDQDADGVPDLIENSGPNGGDANHDTSQDSAQNNVGTTAPGLFGGYGWQAGTNNASQAARTAQLRQQLQELNTPQQTDAGIQGGYFTVQVSGGTQAPPASGSCAQAVDVAPVNPGPLGVDKVAHHGTYTYPRGLLRFELPRCLAANVDIFFNAATFGPGWSWRFYGPSTPGDNTTMGWHDAATLVTGQPGTDWQIHLSNGNFGSYRPAITQSILFEGGPAYNNTIFSDDFQ